MLRVLIGHPPVHPRVFLCYGGAYLGEQKRFEKWRTAQVEGQLRQKDDMGDALHYIDFHQLQIENKQYVSRIEERNDELLKVTLCRREWSKLLNIFTSDLPYAVFIAAIAGISIGYPPYVPCMAERCQSSQLSTNSVFVMNSAFLPAQNDYREDRPGPQHPEKLASPASRRKRVATQRGKS